MKVLDKGLGIFLVFDSVLSIILFTYMIAELCFSGTEFCNLMWGFSVPFGIFTVYLIIPAVIWLVICFVKYMTTSKDERDSDFLKLLVVNTFVFVVMYLLGSYWIMYH